ncbi:MAG: ABC transporter permease subunit [Desulfatiglandales bacterium]
MRNIFAIAGRELRAYFGSPWSYVITAVFLVIAGYGFAWNPSTYMETTIRGLLGFGSFFLLILTPALTMRLFAKELEMGTIELLLTAPVRDIEVVLGKYLASLGILTGMLILTFYYPFLLFWFGEPDFGPLASGYLGIFLLGAVFLSVGLFTSSLSSNQVVAFVLGSGILFALWFVGQAASFFEGATRDEIRHISFSWHFSDFCRGVIDTKAIIYYVSVVALFLFLTLRSVEMRRWK